jgi:hypothetical protein
MYGYSLGAHSFSNFFQYLAWVVAPWGLPEPVNYVWLIIAISSVAYISITKKSAWLLFLAIAAVLAFLPVINFPWFFTRYLYMSVMASAVLLALLIDRLVIYQSRFKWVSLPVSLIIAMIVLTSSFGSANAAADFAEIGRQTRVAFRDISQRHATFPKDTLIYFVDPLQPISQYSGMFFIRYGPSIHVSSTEASQQRVELRHFPSAYVIYFDEEKRTREIAVNSSAVSASLSIDWNTRIQLLGYELPSTQIRSGDAIVLILYWQSSQPLTEDYVVKLELVDASSGNVVASQASEPRSGKAPTSTWKAHELVTDVHVLEITPDVSKSKNLLLKLTLIELNNLGQVGIQKTNGESSSNEIVIQPISIVQ